MERKLTELTNEELRTVNGGNVSGGFKALGRGLNNMVSSVFNNDCPGFGSAISETFYATLEIGVSLITFRWS